MQRKTHVRFIMRLTVLIFAFLIAANTKMIKVDAEVLQSGVWKYEIDGDGSVSVKGYTGDDPEIVIPETIEGKTVSDIGAIAFRGCSSLTGIIIPDGITSIGERAFEGCSSLAGIEIPASVTSIGRDAFIDTKWIAGRRSESPLVIVNNIS